MRICFLGTPEPAVPALQALLDDPATDVVAVITNPDRPRGRGHRLAPPPVKVVAQAAGVPVWQPTRPREVLDQLGALHVDACAVVAYGALLPADVLAAGGAGFVNLHFSVLPRWRGAAPVQHALLAGDDETGVTCFVLDEGMDTGPVLLSEQTPIAPRETAGELLSRLADLGAPVLVRALHGLVEGTIVPRAQDDEGATLAPKIRPEDARVDWTRPAIELDRAVRAYHPVPGAHTTLRGERLKLHRAEVASAQGEPGEVVRLDAEGPVVACADAGLRLTEVQPAGKPRMPGEAFANGYRPLGERLGDHA